MDVKKLEVLLVFQVIIKSLEIQAVKLSKGLLESSGIIEI